MIDYNFYQTVERTHKYVKYSDTDSLFLNIPQLPADIKSADEISKFINDNITYVMEKFLLPKMGINPEHNYTDFKNEIIISVLLLLDVKKNYAYSMIAKEGKVVDPPKCKYTGIPIIRNDSAKFTQYFLKTMIDNFILSGKYKTQREMLQAITNFAHEMKSKLDEDILNFRFEFIGIPCKWGGRVYQKDPASVVGMKLYNTIINQPMFGPMTSGRRVLIKIKNPSEFITAIAPVKNNHKLYINDIDIGNLTNIVIPYTYESKQLEELFNRFSIVIDSMEMWNTLFSTTCKRVINVVKGIA